MKYELCILPISYRKAEASLRSKAEAPQATVSDTDP